MTLLSVPSLCAIRPPNISILPHSVVVVVYRNPIYAPSNPQSQLRSSFPLLRPRVSITGAEGLSHADREVPQMGAREDLGPEGEVFRKTLRLVECAMLASVGGLTYILSNSLAIENYFGCFFALPIVLSSMRWGLAAGRKTVVATAMLLLTLAGPVKATTYLLLHGSVGLAMGSLWSLGVDWGLSIFLCALVRALGAVGYVLLSSFLIRENILNLITINIHAALMGVLAAVGVNTMLTMNTIYTIFTVLVSFMKILFLMSLLILLQLDGKHVNNPFQNLAACVQQWLFLILGTHSICCVLYQAWDEGFIVSTQVDAEGALMSIRERMFRRFHVQQFCGYQHPQWCLVSLDGLDCEVCSAVTYIHEDEGYYTTNRSNRVLPEEWQ